VIELQISDDADADNKIEYKTQFGGSVSAPATPAKKGSSSSAKTAGTATMLMDADSSLDMSTRSLLEVQTTDGVYILSSPFCSMGLMPIGVHYIFHEMSPFCSVHCQLVFQYPCCTSPLSRPSISLSVFRSCFFIHSLITMLKTTCLMYTARLLCATVIWRYYSRELDLSRGHGFFRQGSYHVCVRLVAWHSWYCVSAETKLLYSGLG